LFCNSILDLLIAILISSLNAISIVFMNECPLTRLEQKYLKKSGSKDCIEFLKNLNIHYDCNHIYEKQLEGITILLASMVIKVLFILFLKMFHIKLKGNEVYV